MDSTISEIELPPRNLSQRWRRYGHDAKRRVFERFSKWCPKGTATSNLFIYLKTDQTFPEFVLKSVIGFFGGIVLTYLCFVFFVFQLSISLIHATIISSIIGVLLTFGLAFSYRIRCLVFLLIPQLFSRVGRYTLTCYALILILTGPATNTLKNSEVLTESMACTQEQIKTDVKQIMDSVEKPLSPMKDGINVMIKRLNEIAYRMDVILEKINKLAISIVDVLQSSYIWLYTVINKCNERFGTPYDHCIRVLAYDATKRNERRKHQRRFLPNISFIAKTVCSDVNFNTKVCEAPEYVEESIAATIKRKLRTFINRVKTMFLLKVHMHHSYSFTSNSSRTPSQITAGIVTEIRNRADALLTWLSWSACITSLFLLLIIFRAKYYQHMFETRSRFDNRYITKELRELDLQRLQEGRETVLPLNRREQAKYVTMTSIRLVATERVHLTRSVVFMTITTFKLMIHMVADYSLYWVLTTIRYHGKRQTQLPPGPMDAGLLITGTGLIADIIRAIFKALIVPVLDAPSPGSCLPDPYPPDLKRYAQIGVLIFFLWFFALFEPYGLRLRHVIMGHYRPERAKARAAWLYDHILRSRGSIMKFARRKLHKEFKYLPEENLTFRHWLQTRIPFRWLRCILDIELLQPKCLLCNVNLPNSELVRCETQNCPGTFCNSCFSDIGRLCTICLSPVDYGDFSDINLEKGSEDSEENSGETNTTNLLPKRKYFIRSNSRDSNERENLIGNMKKYVSRKPRFYSSNQSNKNNDQTPLLYSPNEEPKEDNICDQYLTAKALDFTHFSILKNNVTVGYVYNNYFCDNNDINICQNIFKKYDGIDKDVFHHPRKNCIKYYGTIEKTLDKQHLTKTEIANLDQTKFSQNIRINPKGNNITSIDHPNDIKESYSAAEIFSKTARVRKKSYSKLKRRQSNILSVKRKYSLRKHNRLKNNKIIFNGLKRKLIKTLCYIKSSMTGISNKMETGNIKLNLYDIKKSASTISISKISLSRKVRYRRKGTYRKVNDFQKDRHNTSTAKLHLQENNNKSKTKNKLPFRIGNEDVYKNDKLNICDNNTEIPRVTSKKIHSKNCLNIRNIRKLFSNVIFTKHTLKRTQNNNKSKVDSNFLNYKLNYKRRKKYLYHKMNKENATNKTRKIRNDIELTRKYRINSFLKEGEWLKGKFGAELLEPAQEKIGKKDNNVENFCLSVTNCIQGITKENIPKANKHLSCTCNYNKICDSTNALDLKMDTKEDYKSSEKSIYHTHLPVLSTSHSHEETGNIMVGDIKLSSPVNSFSLKNVKLYIANKFLHLKFGNPLTILRTLVSTISLAKEKTSTTAVILQGNQNTVDKNVDALPIVKSGSCQCGFIKDAIKTSEICRVSNSPTFFCDHKDEKQTQTEMKLCTCATQYTMDDIKKNNYDSFIHDLYKGCEKHEARSKEIKSFTSDSTKTDTTLCSCITIDYIDEIPKVKKKAAASKVNVITKSNQSTATDKANFHNASTVTDDWWSPMVEKKEMDYKRGDHICKKRRETKPAKNIQKRLVTFKSRTQIIPNEDSYTLSPSRYLLESQKYYNELFSPRFYAPHLFPVKRTTQEQMAAHISTNPMNKNHKTKRLEQRRSSTIKEMYLILRVTRREKFEMIPKTNSK